MLAHLLVNHDRFVLASCRGQIHLNCVSVHCQDEKPEFFTDFPYLFFVSAMVLVNLNNIRDSNWQRFERCQGAMLGITTQDGDV